MFEAFPVSTGLVALAEIGDKTQLLSLGIIRKVTAAAFAVIGVLGLLA